MSTYPVAIIPTNEFFEDLDWVYEGDGLPEPDEEITVTAVRNQSGEKLNESAVVRVSSVGDAESFPITATPL